MFESRKFGSIDKIEKIEEFYKRKFNLIPDNIRNVIGHFNVFELLHFAMKMQPTSKFDKQTINASQRILTLFCFRCFMKDC